MNEGTEISNQGLSREQLGQLIKEANIPTLPTVAQKLVQICNDDNANFAEFARVIESDAGFASKILRTVNSAYYGLRIKATTLQKAISALGLKYVKSVSLGFHLATNLNKFKVMGFDMSEFWKQSLLRAVLARQIAKQYCPERREEAFLIGLMLDSGVPLLIEILGEEYAKIWQDSKNSQISLYRMEKRMFAINHLEAAAALAEQWSLPELVSQPICTHHLRSQSHPSMDEQVQLEQIAYFAGSLPLSSPETLCDEDLTLTEFCQRVFGLDKDKLKNTMQNVQQEFGSMVQLFGDILPETIDIRALLSQANSLLSDLASDSCQALFDCEAEIKRLQSMVGANTSKKQNSFLSAEDDSQAKITSRMALNSYLEESSVLVKQGSSSLTVLAIGIDEGAKQTGKTLAYRYRKTKERIAKLLTEIFKNAGCVADHDGIGYVVAVKDLTLKQSVRLAQGLMKKCVGACTKASQTKSGGYNDVKPACYTGMLFCEKNSKVGGHAQILELTRNQLHLAMDDKSGAIYYDIISPVEKEKQLAGK